MDLSRIRESARPLPFGEDAVLALVNVVTRLRCSAAELRSLRMRLEDLPEYADSPRMWDLVCRKQLYASAGVMGLATKFAERLLQDLILGNPATRDVASYALRDHLVTLRALFAKLLAVLLEKTPTHGPIPGITPSLVAYSQLLMLLKEKDAEGTAMVKRGPSAALFATMYGWEANREPVDCERYFKGPRWL
jgi:hypothetical protein